jgi:RNA polymerase sigma-70 factor (ECF subfamily)
LESPTEVRLAERLMRGDLTAFDEFVDTFRGKLFQFSYLNCGHHEDAEEVAQETLLKAFESFGQLQDPANVKPWIFRIARNFCFMKRRKSAFAPARELSLDELTPASGVIDWRALPDQAAQLGEMRSLLERAITALPDLYKNVLLLRDLEELSVKETAEILDVSEDVVKTRLHRARLAVRKQIDEYMRTGAAV